MHKHEAYGEASIVIMGALAVNAICIVLKIYLYFLTMSLAVIAYIMDTVMDVINDVVALYGTKMASKPPDAEHPYGHGKYDAFISVFIASAVVISAIEIFREVAQRIIYGSETVVFSGDALMVFVVLMFIYLGLAGVEFYMAKKLEISIMSASAFHYLTDPLYTLGVLLSVYLSSMGFTIVDIVASIAIGLSILLGGVSIVRKQAVILLDAAVFPKDEIVYAIKSNFSEVLDVHNIRSRSDGLRRYLEFHVVMDDDITLKRAHDVCEEIEEFLKRKYGSDLEITIHFEPKSCLKR